MKVLKLIGTYFGKRRTVYNSPQSPQEVIELLNESIELEKMQ